MNTESHRPEAEWPQWINAELCAADRAVIDARDVGFLRGEAVFTTLRVRARRPLLFELHLQRMTRTLRVLFDVDDSTVKQLARGVSELLEAIPADDFALRMTYSRGVSGRGPTLLVQARPLPKLPAGEVSVCIEPAYRPAASDPFELHKHVGRLPKSWARERARSRGAWDALLENTAGELCEATAANLIVVLAGEAFTPPLASGCLPGCVRSVLIAAGGLSVRALTRRELIAAEELLLTNSLSGVVGVNRCLPANEMGAGVEGLPGSEGAAVRRLAAHLLTAEEDTGSLAHG